jgi:hypothetical protein
MAQTLQVTCISKTNRSTPHERISYIGGAAWRFTEGQAINFIEGGMFNFFVRADGRLVRLVVATCEGQKYLKTLADGELPDKLLSLPECQYACPPQGDRPAGA